MPVAAAVVSVGVGIAQGLSNAILAIRLAEETRREEIENKKRKNLIVCMLLGFLAIIVIVYFAYIFWKLNLEEQQRIEIDRVHQEMIQMEFARQHKEQMQQADRQLIFAIIGSAAAFVVTMIWLTRRSE
uniref:Uncharacterized protein n=1 Tax=Panagrolaimus sp. ES5 TaxID=591445 RepID=A0AC34FHM5_9BILA